MSSNRYIASIDQGTASSRCLVFDERARIVSVGQKEHRQIFPRPGWVEHDPVEIWHNVLEVVQEALGKAQLTVADLVAVGITNQRETTVVWDRATGKPVQNAVNWQDIRTDHLIRELAGDAGQDRFRERCGLPLATYFSGPKLRWLLDHVPGLRERGRGRRGAVRDDGHVADLEPDRPPRHRRHERRPDDADEPRDARMGRRAARRHGRAARHAARDPLVVRGLRRGRRPARRAAGRGRARRPARGAVRPDLLRARRGQVHVRHRQLPAAQHRRAAL